MNFIEKIEEYRCRKCPAHYGGFNGEDYDDGCIINPDYETKMCWKAFLPRFVINRMIRKEEEREMAFIEKWMKDYQYEI